jgi:hypothetical protein
MHAFNSPDLPFARGTRDAYVCVCKTSEVHEGEFPYLNTLWLWDVFSENLPGGSPFRASGGNRGAR